MLPASEAGALSTELRGRAPTIHSARSLNLRERSVCWDMLIRIHVAVQLAAAPRCGARGYVRACRRYFAGRSSSREVAELLSGDDKGGAGIVIGAGVLWYGLRAQSDRMVY